MYCAIRSRPSQRRGHVWTQTTLKSIERICCSEHPQMDVSRPQLACELFALADVPSRLHTSAPERNGPLPFAFPPAFHSSLLRNANGRSRNQRYGSWMHLSAGTFLANWQSPKVPRWARRYYT